MRDEFMCVEPGRGSHVEIVQDADACMQMYIICVLKWLEIV